MFFSLETYYFPKETQFIAFNPLIPPPIITSPHNNQLDIPQQWIASHSLEIKERQGNGLSWSILLLLFL